MAGAKHNALVGAAVPGAPPFDTNASTPATLKLVLWACLLASAAIAILGVAPPRARDETAPPDQFSAARAKLHLQHIAREPHPIGSAANRRVRDYLVAQLTALGAEVRVERTVGVTSFGRQIYAGTAENIVATVKGSANSRAVILAAHYDSVPESPGAADAGSGVAGILEVLRALRSGAPLQNDLVILYTDGEEEGLTGAAGFVRDHPEVAQRVGLVMNFEARGSSGAALLFETSDDNGWITREFARAAPYPAGSSLAYAVYKRMPNNTDMTVFKNACLSGLNFAFSATFQNYHTRRDTADNLDLGSLQHLGANALALTRHFGNLPLHDTRPPNRVFFNPYGNSLIHYPPSAVWIFEAIIGGVLVAVLIVHARLQLVSAWRVLGAAGGFVLVLLATAAGAYLVCWIVLATTADRLLVGDTTSNAFLAIGCLAAALAFGVATQRWLAPKVGRHNFVAGQLVCVAVGTIPLGIMLPAASYVAQWPLLFALLGFGAALAANNSTGAAVSAFIGSLPAILIFAPLMYLLFVILGMNAIAVCVLAVLLSLLLAVISPLMTQIGRPLHVILPLLLICSVAFAFAGRQLSRFSPEHPRRNSIVYSVNADEQRAAWLSYDEAPDDWTAQFLTNEPARGAAPQFTVGSGRTVLSHPAELLPIEPPRATVVSEAVVGNGRVLKLHIASVRNANTLLMRMGADVKLAGLSISGREHPIEADATASGSWLLRYNAIPPEGFEVELRLVSTGPVDCWLGDRAFGLPEIPGDRHRRRPPDMMASDGSDVTIVTRRLVF